MYVRCFPHSKYSINVSYLCCISWPADGTRGWLDTFSQQGYPVLWAKSWLAPLPSQAHPVPSFLQIILSSFLVELKAAPFVRLLTNSISHHSPQMVQVGRTLLIAAS